MLVVGRRSDDVVVVALENLKINLVGVWND